LPITSPTIFAHLRYARFDARPIVRIPYSTRRCAGFNPSRASGSARPMITLIA
jgi:hypothetical protein